MQNTPHALMLFAAGFGTRMGMMTRTTPKPLIPVAGRPLIDYALDMAQGAGIRKIVANTHYLGESVSAHLLPENVQISHESPNILETGGGLRKALPLLGDRPVFTLNTDAVWTGENPLTALAAHWDPIKMDALLMLVPANKAQGHAGKGDFTLNGAGHIRRGNAFVYTGAQIIKTDGLQSVPHEVFSLNVLWDKMIERDRLFGMVHTGGWCDVGTVRAISIAETMLKEAADV